MYARVSLGLCAQPADEATPKKNPVRFLNAILLKLGFYRRLPNGSGSLESARRFRTFLVSKLLNGGHGHEE
jgi:hypothetical protein